MLRNYLVVALRNIVKHRLYTAINVLGLSIGLAACLVIVLFVRDETSYDRFWKRADRIYRLTTTFTAQGREPLSVVRGQGPARDAFLRAFPELDAGARLNEMQPTLRVGERVTEETVTWVDPEVLDLLDFDVRAGDLKRALADNSSLAVSRTFATKLFGAEEPLGRTVTFTLGTLVRDYRVAAVYEDLPENTVLSIGAMVRIDEKDFLDQPWRFAAWFSVNNVILFRLREGASIGSVTPRLPDFVDRTIDASPIIGAGAKASTLIRYRFQKLTDAQLHPVGLGELKPTGDARVVFLFASVAGLILLIACINFMNLATARSTGRAREVALRKVHGAHRSQLVLQFLGESVLMAAVALLIALALVELLLPSFGAFLGKKLVLPYGDPTMLATLGGIVLFVGLVGGTYPALLLSGFRPARILKANRSTEATGSLRLRNALVVFQFFVSIALIGSAAVVWLQMRYTIGRDPGYRRESMLLVRNLDREAVSKVRDVLRNEVRALPGVTSVALSGETPMATQENNMVAEVPGPSGQKGITLGVQDIDEGFLRTYGIQLLAGRDLSIDRATDAYPSPEDLAPGALRPAAALVNRSALARLGLGSPEEALGRTFRTLDGDPEKEPATVELSVVGVIPDIHFQSLQSVIRPEVYVLRPRRAGHMAVHFSGDPAALVSAVGDVWRRTVPEVPFRFDFLDEVLAKQVEEERRRAILLGTFSFLAVVVACLGLYGLASFAAERRTREIGIRKVLGASVTDIVRLLVWQFSRPVLLANLLAWPVAGWLLLRWLESFPYRIPTWTIAPACLGAGVVTLLVAWLTVGGNAAAVARAKPIDALRYE